MRIKRVLIGVLLFLLVPVTVGGFLAYRFFLQPLVSGRLKVPDDLQAPRVVLGADVLAKTIFFEDKRLGPITDILALRNAGFEVAVAGSKGAAFLHANAQVRSSVLFSAQTDRVKLTDVDGDGIFEFVNRGAWALNASLLDSHGNTVWAYGGMLPGVDDMASGDLDGDGSSEYVVGFNGDGGVHLLDKNGKLRCKQPDANVWHVEIVDTNGDERPEIVHSNAGGQITVRDGAGNIIRRSKPNLYFSSFSLTQWPRSTDRAYLLVAEDDIIWIMDFDGKAVQQFKAPQSGKLGEASGTLIGFDRNQPDFFAVLVTFTNWHRSILYVYNYAGDLVFQEILGEAGSSVAVLPRENSESQTLLVGGEGRVWQYKSAR